MSVTSLSGFPEMGVKSGQWSVEPINERLQRQIAMIQRLALTIDHWTVTT